MLAAMDARPQQVSLLLALSAIDCADRYGSVWKENAVRLRKAIASAPKSEIETILVSLTSIDSSSNRDYIIGLLYIILTEPEEAPEMWDHLQAVVRDDFASLLKELTAFIFDNFYRVLPVPRAQIVWLTRKLIEAKVHLSPRGS